MKWRISTIVLAVALVLVSCGTETADASDTKTFEMKETESDWYFGTKFKVSVDTHTDVEYIVVETEDGVAITPRLKGAGNE